MQRYRRTRIFAAVVNLNAAAFESMCAFALTLIGNCMQSELHILGKELRLDQAIPHYAEALEEIDRVQVYAFCDKHSSSVRKGGPMRKWGVLISIIYALIVLGLLTPMAVLLAGPSDLREFSHGVLAAYREWLAWFPIVIVLGGQALLFFLSVDTSQKRLKPRSHILLSCVLAGILTALLAFALIGAIGVAVQGDRFGEGAFANPFLFFGLAWLFWGIVFYFFLRNTSEIVNRVTSWLLRGSRGQ